MNNLFEFFNNIINNIKGNIIDYKYLRELLKNWKIKDFRFNEEGMITNEFAITELKKIFMQMDNKITDSILYILISKNYLEIQNAGTNPFCKNGFMLLNFCMSIYNNYSLKIDKANVNEIVCSKLSNNLMNNYQGLILSYLSGDFLTVIQKSRMIYENYVISLFISKNKQLSEAFLEHGKISEYKILENLNEYSNEETSEIINILKKYGEGFSEDFGWTKSVITEKKKRKLITLASYIGIDKNMEFVYKLSSNMIHTNSFSISLNSKKLSKIVDHILEISNDILISQIILYLNEIHINENEKQLLFLILLNKFKNNLVKSGALRLTNG